MARSPPPQTCSCPHTFLLVPGSCHLLDMCSHFRWHQSALQEQAITSRVACAVCTWPSTDLPVGTQPVEFKKTCQHAGPLPPAFTAAAKAWVRQRNQGTRCEHGTYTRAEPGQERTCGGRAAPLHLKLVVLVC